MDKVTKKFVIDFKPKFMVADASSAIVNATKKNFPECVILMCWFHVKLNVRKHKAKIPSNLYRKTLSEINCLHYTNCVESYEVNYEFTINLIKKIN